MRAEERARIGVHTCPGGDRDSTHSADVNYVDLLPNLLRLDAGNFYIALAGEPDRERALAMIRDHLRPDQRIFVGVIAPIDPRIETPEEVRDRVLEAARYIPVGQLGTTDRGQPRRPDGPPRGVSGSGSGGGVPRRLPARSAGSTIRIATLRMYPFVSNTQQSASFVAR